MIPIGFEEIPTGLQLEFQLDSKRFQHDSNSIPTDSNSSPIRFQQIPTWIDQSWSEKQRGSDWGHPCKGFIEFRKKIKIFFIAGSLQTSSDSPKNALRIVVPKFGKYFWTLVLGTPIWAVLEKYTVSVRKIRYYTVHCINTVFNTPYRILFWHCRPAGRSG